jgi:hypothetical protein
MKNLSAVLVLIVIVFGSSMTGQNDETETVTLPDRVMEQVVQRIVIAHFASEKRSREIPFAERNIRSERLPKMRGLTFTVLSDSEIEELYKEIHFFKEPRRVGDVYEIDFGWGDPDCDAMGETWQFRIVGESVLGERTTGGWGMGCSSGH